ncbi:two-partner secretion domain-containing protein [Anabaenopsis elenkinii]|uniref:Filamentous hemagglutinin N-terminal domain-containing protein n=1 Tax=Anabaenopsis elenkinii CCIBt3563 TaxID=2779889 RepID=A0A7U3RY02_9CYAN|nr:filamentous hemagglutinin N-terminal domain-containing protein [Anabaenopsis elenkinii]QOV21760.1 filamentous hemagglutinin N-terminal domain-containing protein [Anabaenopsis elenkinii CCIBt3563]
MARKRFIFLSGVKVMKIQGLIKHPSCYLFLQMVIGLITTANMQMVTAQLTPDNTLNSTVRNDTVNNRDIIEGGAIRGSNLFHSFTDFNVGADRGVYFSHPDSIGNIFTRVTGTNPSSILGTLGVLGNANLFLINPHGISFGDNARLDVKGSFIAASAHSIIFDNYEFSSTDTTAQPLLTVNIPRGLRFREHPGNITLTNSSLSVPEGKTLALIGGNVSLNNTQIRSPGSTVQLGGLTQAGRVDIDDNLGLSFPRPLDSAATNITRGNVNLGNSTVIDVASGGGGSITINSQNLEITGNSQLRVGIAAAMGSPDAQGGDIQINNADKITLDNSFIFAAMVSPDAQGGDIQINNTDKITLDNSFIFNEVFGQGNAGSIHINTSSLTLKDFGFINASISGQGNTGAIAITATDGVTLTGENSQGLSSYIASTVLPTGEGNSGGITIDTSTLTLENGSNINTYTSGQGNAGAINITATDAVTLRGENRQGFSSYIASAVAPTGEGNSGGITIDTSTLTLEGGVTINASTFGQGNAGAITIKATDGVTLTGENRQGFSSYIANAVAPTGEGNSGGITIDTSTLTLEKNSFINASTFGKGNAGAINITATDRVTLRGENRQGFSSYIASTVLPTGEGNSGGITINTSNLTLEDGANINTSTSGKGNAGAINITATDGVSLRGENSQGFSSYIASAVGAAAPGSSGDITIDTSTLTLENGSIINASTFGKGNAGAINIRATEQVGISGTYFNPALNTDVGGIVAFTLTDNNAGNITINTPRFQISDGAGVEAFTQGAGNAGNVTITAPQIVDIGDNSKIIVETSSAGRPGNININTDTLNIGKDAQLSATATATATNTQGGGSITLNSSNLNISGKLGIFAQTQGQAPAGNLTLQPYNNHPNLNINFTDNGFISASTTARGAGGNITLTAPQQMNIQGNGKISVETSGSGNAGQIAIKTPNLNLAQGVEITASTSQQGNAGNIQLYITDNLRLNNSSISSSTTPDSTGRGGNIIIDPILIELNSGSTIAVNSAGAGDGGNIFLTGENLNLSQGSTITANTASGEGGNITLKITDTIRQRDRSNISATAGGSGNGGNITVNTSFLLSRDSNITADAFAGRGGNINITAQRIFQDRDSKITASSQLGIDGVIETNTPEVDPIQGLIEFPEDVLDPNALIAQNACRQWGKSEFTVRGKGGLPGSPEQIHSSHEVGVSLIAPTTEESSAVVSPVSIMTRRVIPAQGWVVNAQGDVVLVADPRGNNPQRVPVAVTCASN